MQRDTLDEYLRDKLENEGNMVPDNAMLSYGYRLEGTNYVQVGSPVDVETSSSSESVG